MDDNGQPLDQGARALWEGDSNRNKSTILIVDDEPLNLKVLGALLQPHYRVRAVSSGKRALEAVFTAPRPDLILLDIMMPEMDGYEVLRRLQDNPESKNIPVIFVTALQDEEQEVMGFELGVVDYIHKPIRLAIALSRIRNQLDAKAARDMLRRNNSRLADAVAEGAHALEQTQLQLLQSEKMAAMGQLSAGIAHEINNPIGYVDSNLGCLGGYLEEIFSIITAYERIAAVPENAELFEEVAVLRQSLNYDYLKQDVGDLLVECRDGIARVRKIVQDLRNFSHVGENAWQWVDIHEGLESTLNIVWHELKVHVVRKQYGQLPKIRCLPSQLNQVFMNLMVNASQAISGQGEILIATECVGDDRVRVIIKDSGAGIAPEVLPRIFDPFFTTKPVGKGTGLGLSLAWSIIERHHGKIEVASTINEGTTFTVTLPVGGPVSGSQAGSEGKPHE